MITSVGQGNYNDAILNSNGGVPFKVNFLFLLKKKG